MLGEVETSTHRPRPLKHETGEMMSTDKKKFKLPAGWDKAFKISAKDPRFGGTIKFVKFLKGVGVLSWRVIAEQKNGWIDHMHAAPFAMPRENLGFTMMEYVKYFKRRGFKIEEITIKKADEIHEKYNAAVKKMINDADIAAQKAGRAKKDKELGREGEHKSIHAAPGDGDGGEPEPEPDNDNDNDDPDTITFACTECSSEWDAVDLGMTDPIVCPECGKSSGIPKPDDNDNE